MTDNVIILGAGFSYDAGIPLLGNFIERMLDYSIRGKAEGNELSAFDKDILSKALAIRLEMDGYHGRVAFNDRNIEDILSMLAFNVLGGGTSESNKLKAFTKAISTTIELACEVKHPGYTPGQYSAISDGSNVYRRFWQALIRWYSDEKSFPTIITFNYDLVLERSLFQVLTNTIYSMNDNPLPFKNLMLDYQYENFPLQQFEVNPAGYGDGRGYNKQGTVLKPLTNISDPNRANIELLKLHGSLNFPNTKPKQEDDPISITKIIEAPYILPPVSNKQSNGSGELSWKIALQRLRCAKNVTFVGYSLPKTDMYMQFFLKAALGPNQDLNKITVFDPLLWNGSKDSDDMRRRYEMCFSEQLRNRIEFKPEHGYTAGITPGTTDDFVSFLEHAPRQILF